MLPHSVTRVTARSASCHHLTLILVTLAVTAAGLMRAAAAAEVHALPPPPPPPQLPPHKQKAPPSKQKPGPPRDMPPPQFGDALDWNGAEDPFSVIWNVPSFTCVNYGTPPFSFSEYEIKVNDEGSHDFHGEVIHLFYWLGKWPVIGTDGSDINGGIPQLSNLSAHYAQVMEDLNYQMPDKDFSGLAIIDFEAFRINWEQNFGILTKYRDRSKQHVYERHPEYSDEKIAAVAKAEFESAARALFEGTLSLVRALRPKAIWTYYGYPHCFNRYDDNMRHCYLAHQDINDESQWLYQAMAAITPSTYMVYSGNPDDNTLQESYIYARAAEALRLAANRYRTTTDHPARTYVYANLWYYSGKMIYDFDYYPTLSVPADLGAAGVVIWGSSSNVNSRDKCAALHEFFDTVVGPFTRDLVRHKRECAYSLCSGRGRCAARALRDTGGGQVDINEEEEGGSAWRHMAEKKLSAWHNSSSSTEPAQSAAEGRNRFSGYSCVCYPGWTGPECSSPL